MKVDSAVLAMAVAFGMISGACTSLSNTPSGSGGSSSGGGTGGSSSGVGGGASCSSVSPCGGSVVGAWTVSSSCLKLGGNLDISTAGLDPSNCKNVTIAGSLSVSGTWTANANGTYTDATTTTGNAQIQLPAGCLNISGTTTTCMRIAGPLGGLGFASLSCTDATGGGCTCAATVQQMGGIGWLTSDPQVSGNYATSGNTLTADSTTTYSYCVAGNTMTSTPQSVSPTTTGTIELQKGGGPISTGGTSGTGGSSPGSGGRGGTTGSGGRGGTTGAAGTPGTGGASGAGGSTSSATGPCDIYAAASPATPCAAAYSPVRLLNSKYSGPIYQVRKGGGSMNTGTGGTTMDIGIVGGYPDSAAQDAFCGTDTCTFSIVYDQSGKGNNLKVAPAGCYNDGSANTPDYESSATRRSLMINGHKVYALYMNAHEGYRNNATTGMPVGATAEGVYEIADGKHAGTACCWDFGNASTDNCNTSIMNTLFFGTGFWGTGAGAGPWFMGDFEGGVWSGGSGASTTNNPMSPSMNVDYAFGVLKTSSAANAGQYAIRVANAQSGSLTTTYDGASPKPNWNNKGGIILGIGGDNSNHSFGTFFEGAITTGRPSDATDAAVLANAQAAGYGR